jgi:RNA polymerase sigma factor (sigma-70 family)
MVQPSSRTPDSGSDGQPPIDWPGALAEHERWLRTVARGRLRDCCAVDDVMQEVALAVVNQEPPALDPSKVAPWLYRVTIRQTLMYRRRVGRERKLMDRYAGRSRPAEMDASVVDPLDWILWKELREFVRTAISQLPVRDKEILTLKHTEGWTYQELAEHLGVSVKTIESRLLRARRRLRGRLIALGIKE